MNSPRLKNEGWYYWLAFLIAIGFRLVQLGASPLTDSEASLALQALHIAQGKASLLSPQPLYILVTSLFFLVIESTNFMARFIPALAGSALVFVPWFFREKLKPRPALILAFFIVFDPGLVALSRQSSGTILRSDFSSICLGDVDEWTRHPSRYLRWSCASLWTFDLVRFTDADPHLDIITRHGGEAKQSHFNYQ